MFQDLIPGSPKFFELLYFAGKAYSIYLLRVFDICLELPNDSEKYFAFVHPRKL